MSACLIQQLQYYFTFCFTEHLLASGNGKKKKSLMSGKNWPPNYKILTLHNHTLPDCSMSLKGDRTNRRKCHKCWELSRTYTVEHGRAVIQVLCHFHNKYIYDGHWIQLTDLCRLSQRDNGPNRYVKCDIHSDQRPKIGPTLQFP